MADEAVLNNVHNKEKRKKSPFSIFLSPIMKVYIAPEEFYQIYSGFAVLCFPPISKFGDPTVCNCCCFLIFLI